jgi:signal transduction histidine kinase
MGKVAGAVLVIRDRSEERTAEQMQMQLAREQAAWAATQAQRDRMYSLFMQAPAAIAVLRGPEYVYELSNPMNDKLAGRPLTGLLARDAFPKLDAAGIVAQLQRVYQTGMPFVASEMRVPGSPDGSRDIYVNGALQPFRGPSGEVEGVMVFAFDVSKQVIARKRTEALAAVTSALAQAITTADVAEVVATKGCQTVEADACAVFFDDEKGRLSLRARHGLSDEQARELGSTENAATPASVTLHARAPVWIETVEEYRKRFPLAADGSKEGTLFQSLFFFPLLGAEKPLGLVGMGYRESRHFGPDDRQFIETLAAQCTMALHRARLHGELQRAVAVRDDFLSIASHELNTPLTSLKLQLANIQRRLSSGEEVEDKLSTLERLTDRMAKLVGELLDVSRIQTGSLALEREDSVDLGEVVREVIDEMEGELRRAGSDLALQDGVRAVGRWDRMRLAQVVRNLLSNAVKFGRGRPIEVTIAALPKEARLEVKDGGIGIAEQDLSRIFDRFERAVSTRHFGGFGLGLWIVNQIVLSLGGRIAVESVPGRGSTFTVTLPYG